VATAARTATRAPILAAVRRIPRAAARTRILGRHPRRACAWHAVGAASPPGTASDRSVGAVAFAAVNAFHFCGIALALWALVLAFIGVTRENFPTTDGAARGVAAISILLTLLAIGSGIYTAATEEEEGEEGEEAALLLPR
jgi:hypothetical protein